MTVKRQLFVIFTTFAIIPIMIVSGISLMTNIKTVENIHLDRLNSITQTSAAAYTEIVGLRKDEVSLLASSWSMQDYLRLLNSHQATEAELLSAKNAVNEYFHTYIDTLHTFDNLVLLDAGGKVIVGYFPEAAGMDLSQMDYYINIKDNTDSGYVFTSKVHSALLDPNDPDVHRLGLSKALRDSDGNLVAVLVAYVDANFMAKFSNNIFFGKTGLSFVIDADNYILYHPDPRFYNSHTAAPGLVNLLNRYKNGEVPAIGLIDDIMDGKRRIYYYEVMPEIEMVLILRQDYSEFSADRTSVYIYTLVSLLIITLVAIILGKRYSQYFVSPIQKLTSAFSSGEKEGSYNRCEISRKNEFGQMADSYNTMITTLENQFVLLKEEKDKNEYTSLHDEITGLLNRTAFEKEIAHQTLQNTSFGILYVDVDNFKQINYAFGHLCGDALLRAISKRLMESGACFDLCARISGDEFVLSKAGTSQEMVEAAATLQEELRHPFVINDSTFFITVSIGISHYPDHGITSHDLISNADIAMFRIKDSGKNSYCLYDSKMRNNIDRQNSISEVLRNCLSTDEIFFMYQPVYNIEDKEIIGFETLMRIKSNKMGLLSPLEFIPIAENDYLLMNQLGMLSLKSAFCFAGRLHSEQNFNGFVSVNLSAVQLQNPDFISEFVALLEEYKLPENSIQLEIKETLLLPEYRTAFQKVRLLQEKGVLIALDNFDGQISSINHFMSFPLNSVKIGPSFFQDMGSDERLTNINSAVADLIHGFGFHIIAECVETPEEYHFLKALKYTTMQGFFLCKPLMEEHAIKKLSDNTWDIEETN